MALWKPICAAKLEHLKHKIRFLNLLILGLFLSGCVSLYDPESSHEWHSDPIHTLQTSELASQTITFTQSSVSKITLWITSVDSSQQNAKLTLTLYDLNQKPKYLLTTSQLLTACSNQQCSFSIPEHVYLPRGKYALVLETKAPVQ